MWVSELGVVATSNNIWRRHGWLRWTRLKPSPIAMDAINAIIVRRPSAHETTLYTRQPRRRTRQERRESVVSIMTILIPRRQLSSQERQTPRHKRDERKTKKRNSTRVTADRSGKIMPQISRDERGFNNKTYKNDFASKTNKKTKPSWHVRYAAHATITGQAVTRIAWQSHWRPSLKTTEQARATTTKTTILLVLIRK